MRPATSLIGVRGGRRPLPSRSVSYATQVAPESRIATALAEIGQLKAEVEHVRSALHGLHDSRWVRLGQRLRILHRQSS